MCGIVGVLAYEQTNPAQLGEPLRPLMLRMARRGPDDDGAWSDGRCALGFRRLAILDLSPAGHQPMRSADGRYTLVFNGEIYNFRELRDALDDGEVAHSTGDAEVVLRALRAWGTAALARFDGMFALALYDAVEQTLLVARDHAGIKPLFVAQTPHGVVFGSQYDQILAHPWSRTLPIDHGGLGLYLRFGFLPTTSALHTGAGQIAAGTWQRFHAGGRVEHGTHHALPTWQMPVLKGRDAEEALEAALATAVRRHLISDVPVGVFLSGGVDSPLVAAEAMRHHAGPLQAFTIGVDDRAMDETEDARRYAAELGVEHVVETLDGDGVLALLDDVVAACTEPTADYSIFPTLAVSRLARRHVKVVLSGDGGDELYWGYPSRFGSALALAPYFAWPRAARVLAVAGRRVGFGHATRDVLDYDTLGRLYQRKHTLMAEADLARVFPTLPQATHPAFAFAGTAPDEVAQWVRWNEFHIHLARVLAKVDRASMYNALEVRVPLLDKRVIEVAWRTDWQSCLDLSRGVGKLPLREALRRRVRHHTQAKRGFTVPMHAWLAGPLRPLVRELLVERRDFLGLPIAPGAIAALHDRLIAGDRSKAWGLWLLLSLALWERRFLTTPAA